MAKHGTLKIFGGTASSALTEKICAYLEMKRGRATVSRFPDDETFVKIEEDVRGKDVFLVQATCPPVNDNLMELLIFIDCARRASAKRITAVIPYYGYARQDRKSEGRTPITAKLVANMLTKAGLNRVLTINLHADQIQGFFDIPVDHLTAAPVLARHFLDRKLSNIVLLSPDVGNMKFGSDFASCIGGELAVIYKRRISGDSTVAVNIVGNVKDKNVMVFDDMITTAGTVCEAAKLARRQGGRGIFVAAAHAVFAEAAIKRLAEAQLDEIVVTDTIPGRPDVAKTLPNLTVLSVANLLTDAILRIHQDRSIRTRRGRRRDHQFERFAVVLIGVWCGGGPSPRGSGKSATDCQPACMALLRTKSSTCRLLRWVGRKPRSFMTRFLASATDTENGSASIGTQARARWRPHGIRDAGTATQSLSYLSHDRSLLDESDSLDTLCQMPFGSVPNKNAGR
jgi:ribose-phosphate pyrophosphokinase